MFNVRAGARAAIRAGAALGLFAVWIGTAHAITLTFDDAITGQTSYSFDQNNDGIVDAVFSTTDPGGFNTFGPGPNMSYIDEPGLEGTTTLSPDLRVDFPLGAVGSLGFGFAMSSEGNSPNLTVTFNVYDAQNNLLGTVTQLAAYTQPSPPNNSSYPEAAVTVSFAGTARYATLNFNSTDAGRYIIDNFTGTFGSGERPVPVPPAQIPTLSEWGLILLSLMLAAGTFLMLRRREHDPRR
jgi:hypothetical protein